MFDTEYYCKDYLNKDDRSRLEAIEAMSIQIMNEQSVMDFVGEKFDLSRTAKDIAREVIDSYTEYLKERIDVYMLDFIINRIDEYDEDELEAVKRKADERKRLMIAEAVREEQA